MRNEYPSYREGWIQVWKDEAGWHYDGPASCGPREVRKSGRGPFWRGPITPQFAGVLIKRLKERTAAEGR